MQLVRLLVLMVVASVGATANAETPIATGTVDREDIRISYYSGQSFVDFSTANVLTDYIGYKLKVCSATNTSECLVGYIVEAGVGETYGSNRAVNGTFDTDSDWTLGAGWDISGGTLNFANSTGTGVFQQSGLSEIGKLYRGDFEVSGSSVYVSWQLNNPGTVSWVDTTTGSKTYYLTTPVGFANQSFTSSGGRDYSIDNYVCREVLTPSITGVKISSTRGGTDYNWASNSMTTTSSLADSSGYTYSIYPPVYLTISGNDNELSYGVIDCEDVPQMIGLLVTGSGNVISNYTIARCPGGAFQFEESATLKNSIGISEGNDITIASGKTVTAYNNLFCDAAASGAGTYSDTGATTLWSEDPVFVDPDNGNFRLQSTSPAIDAGTRD